MKPQIRPLGYVFTVNSGDRHLGLSTSLILTQVTGVTLQTPTRVIVFSLALHSPRGITMTLGDMSHGSLCWSKMSHSVILSQLIVGELACISGHTGELWEGDEGPWGRHNYSQVLKMISKKLPFEMKFLMFSAHWVSNLSPAHNNGQVSSKPPPALALIAHLICSVHRQDCDWMRVNILSVQYHPRMSFYGGESIFVANF